VQVTTGHGESQSQTQLCDTAHPAAADADEMQSPLAMKDPEPRRITHAEGSFQLLRPRFIMASAQRDFDHTRGSRPGVEEVLWTNLLSE
jgi:hypothetical protein